MEPLVPANIELRDFAFMPLDVVRLRDSDFATESSPEEFRAAILLWCAAWHQVPAASLPDNDRALAKYAGYGFDIDRWTAVRAGAMRGFQLCDDGRLYHCVLAEKALQAWEGKLRQRHKRECERIKKASQRSETKPVYPTFDEWKEHLTRTGEDKWSPDMSRGTDAGRPLNVPLGSASLKGEGQGQCKGEGEGEGEEALAIGSNTTEASTRSEEGGDPIARACFLMEEASGEQINPSREDLVAAITEGISPEALANTVREALASKNRKTSPIAWAIATARSRKTAINGSAAKHGLVEPKPSAAQGVPERKRQPADPEKVGTFMASIRERLGL